MSKGQKDQFWATHTTPSFDSDHFRCKPMCSAEHSHFQVSIVISSAGRLVDASQESEAPVAEECWKPSLGKWLDSWAVKRRSAHLSTVQTGGEQNQPSDQV